MDRVVRQTFRFKLDFKDGQTPSGPKKEGHLVTNFFKFHAEARTTYKLKTIAIQFYQFL